MAFGYLPGVITSLLLDLQRKPYSLKLLYLSCIIGLERRYALSEELYDLVVVFKLGQQFVDIVSTLVHIPALDELAQHGKHLRFLSRLLPLKLLPMVQHKRRKLDQFTIAPVSILRKLAPLKKWMGMACIVLSSLLRM